MRDSAWLGCVALLAFWPGSAPPADHRTLVGLARDAVLAEVGSSAQPRPQTQSPSKPVFVTVERNGRVLGCRGSLQVRSASLELEVIAAARAAAHHDPRYRPLRPEDLKGFLVTVTVVERQERIQSVEGLQPADGLVLAAGAKTGVVLPWEGKDPQVRLGWAYRKAGVREGSCVKLYRLVAERYRG